MEQNVHFQSSLTHDLAVDKEFMRASRQCDIRSNVIKVFCIIYLLFLRLNLSMLYNGWLEFGVIVFLLGSHALTYFRSRKGTFNFRQNLVNNQGKPFRVVISFLDDHLRIVNADSGNSYTYAYDQYRKLYETTDLLILVNKLQYSVLVDKRSLTGGDKDGLIQFLQQRCPNLKKRISKGRIGKIINAVYALVLALCLLLSIFNVTGVGRIPRDADFRQIAAELETMGITGADDALLTELEDTWADYDNEYYDLYYRTVDLLSRLGMGEYNRVTWEWSPGDTGVYWFDTEAYDASSMYTDFLRGVSALGGGELDFEGIKQTVSRKDLLRGTGKQTVTFTWNGQSHTIQAEMYYDWFDPEAVDALNGIIRSGNTGKQLYYAFDGGQGFLVFYRDPLWAMWFQYKTGITLTTTISDYYG